MRNRQSEFTALIDKIAAPEQSIIRRYLQNSAGMMCVLYIKQLTDLEQLSHHVLRPLADHLGANRTLPSATEVAFGIISATDTQVNSDIAQVSKLVLSGMTVVLSMDSPDFVIVNLKSPLKKNIEDPRLTFTLRGPTDCFNENIDSNLSLIRYRIKDTNLRIEMHSVGERTQTQVAMLFIADIANDQYVTQLRDRLTRIHIEGIIESGQLQRLLEDRLTVFPQFGAIERSDMACAALLEGKVVLLVEGSGIALVAPKNLQEFLTSCDDMYDNVYLGAFMKVLRIAAFMLSFTLTPLYVCLVSFNTDFLSADYIITLARSRADVPFTGLFEAALIEFIIEILRESLLRIPKQIGAAIGIVGAIVIGQAAIAAGIFSAPLLIFVSLELIASFVPPDYTITNPLRVFKVVLLLLSGIFGLVGFTVGLYLVGATLASHKSLGQPFLTPFAPYIGYDAARSFFHTKVISPLRPHFMKTKDSTRK